MSSSKIRQKSARLAYGAGLAICFASGMFTSVFKTLWPCNYSHSYKSFELGGNRQPSHLFGLFTAFFRHLHDSHRHRRASRFNTCRVRMPAQQNFAPLFIKSKIASSPSRLITVRLLKSITSLRPSKSRLSFLPVGRRSPTHGSLSFPSTTSLRWATLSIMEILNTVNLRTSQ